MFSLFSEEFSKYYQVILFDPRGTGRTSKPNIDYSIEIFADDVAALLDKINVQNVHVFGF